MGPPANEVLAPLTCICERPVWLLGLVRQVAEAAADMRSELVILPYSCHAQRSLEMLFG
jgi:hypothetical protein